MLSQIPRQHGPLPDLNRTLKYCSALVAVVFLLLLVRLFHLQISHGELYLQKSLDNFIKDVDIPALRGRIKDRYGRVLVDNRPAYNVFITPRFFTPDAMKRLTALLSLDEAAVRGISQKVQTPKGLARFRGVLVLEDVSRDVMALLETAKQELPGVVVEAVPHRAYPHGTLAAHALGYLNEISATELAGLGEKGYRSGQSIGRSGIERFAEPYLRGKGGVERIVVDARGQRKSDDEAKELLDGLRRTDPVPGQDLITTIDLELQEILERAMERVQAGGAVVVDVETGQILAIASRPAFDPNILSGRLTAVEDRRMARDPRRPRIDKVLRENYFPGSTFKIIPALAGLEDGLITPDEKVPCGGGYRFGKRTFRCMEVHLKPDLHQALVESCNSYFYRLGEKVGMDRMARVARELGLGEPSGLGLNGEVAGFIPTTEFYKRTKEGFHPGSTLNTAIGQGSVKTTVLQMAMAYGALVNGGRLFQPQVADRIEAPGGRIVQTFPPRLRRQVELGAEHLTFVRRALVGVLHEKKGTAFAARLPDLEVGGKTGTAQVRKIQKRGVDHVVQEGEWDTSKDHAWFVGFAPAGKPRLVVAALVEHGGLGARAAAPIVMQVLRGYFDKVAPEEKPVPPIAATAAPRTPYADPTPTPVDTAGDDQPGEPGGD